MFVLLLLLLPLTFYLYFTRNHSYWTKRKVKHDPPVVFFGNHYNNLTGAKSITTITNELYKKYRSEKLVGYYRGNTPELIVRDLDLIRHILNVDSSNFYIRGLGRNPKTEPLLQNLFHAEGDMWKLLRQRLTPAFTTTKLKNMFPLVVNCAEKLQNVTEDLTLKDEYDVRELMARFTTEFIGACGFGIEMNSINDDRSQFRELGRVMFTPTLRQILLLGLNQITPELTGHIYAGNKAVLTSLTEIYMNIREQRNGKPIGRNDFIDLLLDLESKGKIKGESIERRNQDGSPVPVEMELDIQCQIAQAFVFFGAGFETSSSATSFLLHQLAYHPDVQQKVQEEIDHVLGKYNGQLCYDAVAEMQYLEMAFKESMRMFPSLGILNRVCVKKYTLPGTDITIDRGVKIIIPVEAIQNDEQYFDNPEEFRPERFSPEEVAKRHKFVYLPFGEGPRACIGKTFFFIYLPTYIV